jgi:SAM-dependent methyltransferase
VGASDAIPPTCPVCGAHGTHPLFETQGIQMFACPVCALLMHSSGPTVQHAADLYDESYFVGGGGQYVDYLADEWLHRRQARYYLRALRRAGRLPGRLLDVGCAAGFFLDEARQAGWTVSGCDVSPFMADFARSKLNLPVLQGDFASLPFPKAGFDVVTLLSVLGHIPDPRAVEARLHELVVPGGLVMVEAWDRQSTFARLAGRRWHQYSPRYVLHHFGRSTFQHLFEPSRWHQVSYSASIKWISLLRGLHVLASGTSGNGPAVRSVVTGRIPVPYAAGDLVLAIFERR